jgi:hypothetical protein
MKTTSNGSVLKGSGGRYKSISEESKGQVEAGTESMSLVGEKSLTPLNVDSLILVNSSSS